MLAIFLSGVWFESVIDQELKETLCVNYFAQLILTPFVNLLKDKADTLC